MHFSREGERGGRGRQTDRLTDSQTQKETEREVSECVWSRVKVDMCERARVCVCSDS